MKTLQKQLSSIPEKAWHRRHTGQDTVITKMTRHISMLEKSVSDAIAAQGKAEAALKTYQHDQKKDQAAKAKQLRKESRASAEHRSKVHQHEHIQKLVNKEAQKQQEAQSCIQNKQFLAQMANLNQGMAPNLFVQGGLLEPMAGWGLSSISKQCKHNNSSNSIW